MLKAPFVLAAFLAFGFTVSVAQADSLKVLSLESAQSAFEGLSHLVCIQNGKVMDLQTANPHQPYCFTWAEHFALDPNQAYPITKIESKTVESPSTGMTMVRNDLDMIPSAFHLSCMSFRPMSVQDFQAALVGIYEILP